MIVVSRGARSATSLGTVIDLYAGPGGWDLGARELGLDPIGIEWDDAACKTREAAGLRTIQGDVAALDPFVAGAAWGLIASPPCQAFSTAGKRLGQDDVPIIVAVARNLAEGHDARTPYREHPDLLGDPRSLLVVEPVRWACAHRDTLRWIALEQVPPVLPLWREFATYFRAWGFSVWTGVVNAADYGVPQTRQRAILLASRDRKPHRPPATHADPRRTLPMFRKPWVSMAEALGWGFDERGSPTVTGGGRQPEDPSRSDDGRGNRWRVRTRGERDGMTGGNVFDADAPSWALTSKARSWKRER